MQGKGFLVVSANIEFKLQSYADFLRYPRLIFFLYLDDCIWVVPYYCRCICSVVHGLPAHRSKALLAYLVRIHVKEYQALLTGDPCRPAKVDLSGRFPEMLSTCQQCMFV